MRLKGSDARRARPGAQTRAKAGGDYLKSEFDRETGDGHPAHGGKSR